MIKPGPWRYPGGPVTAVGTLMVRRKLEEGELEKPARNGMVSTQPGRRRYWVEALDTGSLQGDTQRTGAERGQGICWHSTAGSKDEATGDSPGGTSLNWPIRQSVTPQGSLGDGQ